MREIPDRVELVACCGLYCGACRAYLRKKCDGCLTNERAAWCKIRKCCLENHLSSCAECAEVADPRRCQKFTNLISKLFAFVFRSDRAACIDQIRRLGRLEHAKSMASQKLQSIRRGRA
jgi:hypothetical protein